MYQYSKRHEHWHMSDPSPIRAFSNGHTLVVSVSSWNVEQGLWKHNMPIGRGCSFRRRRDATWTEYEMGAAAWMGACVWNCWVPTSPATVTYYVVFVTGHVVYIVSWVKVNLLFLSNVLSNPCTCTRSYYYSTFIQPAVEPVEYKL